MHAATRQKFFMASNKEPVLLPTPARYPTFFLAAPRCCNSLARAIINILCDANTTHTNANCRLEGTISSISFVKDVMVGFHLLLASTPLALFRRLEPPSPQSAGRRSTTTSRLESHSTATCRRIRLASEAGTTCRLLVLDAFPSCARHLTPATTRRLQLPSYVTRLCGALLLFYFLLCTLCPLTTSRSTRMHLTVSHD